MNFEGQAAYGASAYGSTYGATGQGWQDPSAWGGQQASYGTAGYGAADSYSSGGPMRTASSGQSRSAPYNGGKI